MPHSDDEEIADLEAWRRHDAPRFARGLGSGRPRRPREYRRGRAWLAMVLAIAVLVLGAVLGQGLLLAAGLVMAGAAVNLFDPARRRRRAQPPRP
jgi:Flp pilus assembly protein TadB